MPLSGKIVNCPLDNYIIANENEIVNSFGIENNNIYCVIGKWNWNWNCISGDKNEIEIAFKEYMTKMKLRLRKIKQKWNCGIKIKNKNEITVCKLHIKKAVRTLNLI